MFERMQVNDPENVDLEAVKVMLRHMCGPTVVGAVFGRTRLRDAVARHLGCSLVLGERVLDTMIGRGFLRQQVHPHGWVYWAIH
jgi:hypothetical protein